MDTLGDRCKAYEMQEAGRHIMRGMPLMARLDGRAFHTLTKNMQRPYDHNMQSCMIEATKACVEDLHADVAYTQSDEITLAWYIPRGSKSEYPFGGRYQKLSSILAGIASVSFNNAARVHMPHIDPTAVFDCRVWGAPSINDALDVFVWREDDAVKNSVTMLAQNYFSHNELNDKNTREKLIMLESKNVIWGDEPTHFKRGVYLKRISTLRTLSEAERLCIPEAFRPDANAKFIRSEVKVINIPPIRTIINPLSVLFKTDENS